MRELTFLRTISLGIFFLFLVVSCGGSGSGSTAGEGDSCSSDSDCLAGLVCDAGICSSAGDVDIPGGDLDVVDEDEELFDDDAEWDVEGCDPSMPCLVVSNIVDFGSVIFGETNRHMLELTNAGNLPVSIYGYELCPGRECPAFAVDAKVEIGIDSPQIVLPGETFSWEISFTRSDAADASVWLWIESNHQDGRIIKIELVSREKGSAVFSLEPSVLDFPDTSVLQKSYLDFTLVNTPVDDESTATIEIVSIDAQQPFFPRAIQETDSGCFGPMQGGDRFLASDSVRQCRIMFQPAAGGLFEGNLVVAYRDAEGSHEIEVPLSGRGVQPYMTLSPGTFCGDHSFGDLTVGFVRRELLTVINTSPRQEELSILSAEIEPEQGPFSLRFLPMDQDLGEAEDEPPVSIDRQQSWSLFVEFAPTEEGTFTEQTLHLQTNASGFDDGLAEIELCGQGVAAADSVIGLVIAVPALGTDTNDPEEEPVLPVVHAPVYALDLPYATATDTLGRFVLSIPPEDRPERVTIAVDGTRASNGPFSTRQQSLELSSDEAVEVVIVLGFHDEGNAQPAEAQDDSGGFIDLNDLATNLDSDLSEILVDYNASCMIPPAEADRAISFRRASLLELPLPLPPQWNLTPDPYHVYRLLPIGMVFSCDPATLILPNTSEIAIGTEVGFYMLDGEIAEWTRVLNMRVEAEPLSERGSVIVTPEGGGGIHHFGRLSSEDLPGYDSIGFLARPMGSTPYTVRGDVLRQDGTPVSGAGIQLIGANDTQQNVSAADGSYSFIVRGIPGQRVMVGAYLDSITDGTWRAVTAIVPIDGFSLEMPDIVFPPDFATGTITGRVRYDDGEPIPSGGLVTVWWIHPDNADGESGNDDPALNLLYDARPVLNGGVYLVEGVRTTPDSWVEVFATEPLHGLRTETRQAIIEKDSLTTVDLVARRFDNVPPYVRNAYPSDGSFDVPTDSRFSITVSEPIDQETLISDRSLPIRTIRLSHGSGDDLPIKHFFDEERNLIVIIPQMESRDDESALHAGREYSLELTTGISDPSGNSLQRMNEDLPADVAYRSSFTTVAPACPVCRVYDWVTESCKPDSFLDDTACDDDELECTDDVCGQGECRHDLIDGYCLIDGVCREQGENQLGNVCLWCAPEENLELWSVNSGSPCSDGNDETYHDACNDEGECVGQPCQCVDADNPCCDGCRYEVLGTPCGDTNDSECDHPDSCDGAGLCRVNYEPTSSRCRLSVDECDIEEYCNESGQCPEDEKHPDGAACGSDDQCVEGLCVDCLDSEGCLDLDLGERDVECTEIICGEDHTCSFRDAEDGTLCGTDDQCVSGICSDCHDEAGCDDLSWDGRDEECSKRVCGPANICIFADEREGTACGTDDQCSSGVCVDCISDAGCGDLDWGSRDEECSNRICKPDLTCGFSDEADSRSCGTGDQCVGGACVDCVSDAGCTDLAWGDRSEECSDRVCKADLTCGFDDESDGKVCGSEDQCLDGACRDCINDSGCDDLSWGGRVPACSSRVCSENNECEFDDENDGTACGSDDQCVEGVCADCFDAGGCLDYPWGSRDDECSSRVCGSGNECEFDDEADGAVCGTGDQCVSGACEDCYDTDGCGDLDLDGRDDECTTITCNSNACGFTNEPSLTACQTDGTGDDTDQCDGLGYCHDCRNADGCGDLAWGDRDDECAQVTCDGSSCGFVDFGTNASCQSDGTGDDSDRCDGAGVCLDCLTIADCGELSMDGRDDECSTIACTGNDCVFDDYANTIQCEIGAATGDTDRCNGSGQCVDCLDTSDCSDLSWGSRDTECAEKTCNSNTCGITDYDDTVTCQTDGSGDNSDRCDGSGHCIDCLTVADCSDDEVGWGSRDDECAVKSCNNESCVVDDQVEGTLCQSDGTGDDSDVCDGSGLCLDCVGLAGCDSDFADDGNECTYKACNASNACYHANKVSGSTCGTLDQCVEGVCRDCYNDSGCTDLAWGNRTSNCSSRVCLGMSCAFHDESNGTDCYTGCNPCGANYCSSGRCIGHMACIWDTSTNLMWTTDATSAQTHFNATANCGTLSVNGHSSWRLPTINELRSIVTGCPSQQTGGSCSVTNSCNEASCYSDPPCDGCTMGSGPNGGCYLDSSHTCRIGSMHSSTSVSGSGSYWMLNYTSAGIHTDMSARQTDVALWYAKCVHSDPGICK